MKRSLVSLLLVVCLAFLADLAMSDHSSDPVEDVDEQFGAIGPITPECSVDSTLKWLDRVGDIFQRIARGGVPAMPVAAVGTVKTLASNVVGAPKHNSDPQIILKVVAMLPSLWTAGFFYASPEAWKPLFSAVVNPVTDLVKDDENAYESLVNATSLMVRFTKDTVFFNGEDTGGVIPNAYHRDYVRWLAEIVAKVSKLDDFTLTESQLRAFMGSIPSKKDGMDTSVAFTTFVDTAKYKDSDAAALCDFLSTPQVRADDPAAQ